LEPALRRRCSAARHRRGWPGSTEAPSWRSREGVPCVRRSASPCGCQRGSDAHGAGSVPSGFEHGDEEECA
jgi:hypothetical protein